ncbi:MAG: hypothetical protein LC687_06245 [Actinobacteria bacterium]|nr:hypothetical protein [Actinomycetota bacterium]
MGKSSPAWYPPGVIELMKANAVRAALRIASMAPAHLSVVALYPGGRLVATDGVVMVASEDAHDADISEPLFLRPTSARKGSASAESYRLDIEGGRLIEVRPRSENDIPVEVERGLEYPPYSKLLPSHLSRTHSPPLFDSIIAGRVAEAYGLELGVWGGCHLENAAALAGVEDGDTVVIAGVKRETL